MINVDYERLYNCARIPFQWLNSETPFVCVLDWKFRERKYKYSYYFRSRKCSKFKQSYCYWACVDCSADQKTCTKQYACTRTLERVFFLSCEFRVACSTVYKYISSEYKSCTFTSRAVKVILITDFIVLILVL